MAMSLVSTVTVGSGGAASIEFTGIAATGKDLLVLVSGRDSAGNQTIFTTLNGDTTNANYSWRSLVGTGSAASSSNGASRYSGFFPASTYTANTFGNTAIYIANYTANTAKSISIDSVEENNATSSLQFIIAQRWTGTAAITSVAISVEGGISNLAQNSTASLYIIS
jgi:hypothetical protein